MRIECKGGYDNESKELRGWKSVTAKISFMDLFGAGRDILNNGTSSCILDALTTIANILATFFPPPPLPLSPKSSIIRINLPTFPYHIAFVINDFFSWFIYRQLTEVVGMKRDNRYGSMVVWLLWPTFKHYSDIYL